MKKTTHKFKMGDVNVEVSSTDVLDKLWQTKEVEPSTGRVVFPFENYKPIDKETFNKNFKPKDDE